MGIDAEILIRFRGERPNDEQLTRWSWDLCRSVGAKHFFISDGLPTSEYEAKIKEWHAAFNAHPLYAAWKADHNSAAGGEIRKAVGPAPEALRRAIELTNARYPLDEESEVPFAYRAPGMAWTQDGPPIYAEPGETFMEVSLWTRYYGEGYTRGDILTICAVAEWIEANMAPCEVWYGGDSSGVLAEPFPESRRAELRRHLYGTQGRDYYNHGREQCAITPAPCGLCVPGENRFQQFGFGANYCAVACAGCGENFETRDNGSTWKLQEKES